MPFVCIYCITIDMTSLSLSLSLSQCVLLSTESTISPFVNVPLTKVADDIRWTQRKERRQ